VGKRFQNSTGRLAQWVVSCRWKGIKASGNAFTISKSINEKAQGTGGEREVGKVFKFGEISSIRNTPWQSRLKLGFLPPSLDL
jgi:hypothetical protein